MCEGPTGLLQSVLQRDVEEVAFSDVADVRCENCHSFTTWHGVSLSYTKEPSEHHCYAYRRPSGSMFIFKSVSLCAVHVKSDCAVKTQLYVVIFTCLVLLTCCLAISIDGTYQMYGITRQGDCKQKIVAYTLDMGDDFDS